MAQFPVMAIRYMEQIGREIQKWCFSSPGKPVRRKIGGLSVLLEDVIMLSQAMSPAIFDVCCKKKKKKEKKKKSCVK